MKRKLMIIGTVAMMFSLTACNTDNNNTNTEEPKQTVEDTNDKIEEKEDIKKEPIKEEPIEKDPIESQEIEEEDLDQNINKEENEDKPKDEEEDIVKTDMTDEEMIESSDYIAKVKMIQKGQNKFELKVLENIKGNINASNIPNTDKFNQNRAYVIFLRDTDGNIEPTSGDKSYILLEGDNHEIFEKINRNVNR